MCQKCDSSNYQGVYNANVFNTSQSTPCGHPRPCNGCIDITKGECIVYTGVNLTNSGINKSDTLNAALVKLDEIKRLQDVKNGKILTALNDINTRLNAIETGADHQPYTL